MDNVVLFGFMGCGKSTVGALLARKTGRPLLDTDGSLEQKYGRSIPQIFASDGEEAFAGWNGRCAGNWPDGKT